MEPDSGSIRVILSTDTLVGVAISGNARLIKAEKSRTLSYISAQVASDSAFPFAAGEQLIVTIDKENRRLLVEKARDETPARAARSTGQKRTKKASRA